MKRSKKTASGGFSRRDVFKLSGITLGGMALGVGVPHKANANLPYFGPKQKNSSFRRLLPYIPGTESLGTEEMRITFMGSWYAPRLAQACNSVFVELGNGDSFVFDCGSGVMAKYNAMGIPLSRMDKIFLTHIHGDHMSDLTHIYTFGPAYDRKTPLYVFGPANSGLIYTDPDGNTPSGQPYDDGTAAYCSHLREATRWHTESFGFESTAYVNYGASPYTPPAWAPQDKKDAYDLVPFELPLTDGPDGKKQGGVAYDHNGVTISYFPAVHTRFGAISYKLEWNGLSMIFTGDTKPNNYVIQAAKDGVDVLIHEMATSAEVWARNFLEIHESDDNWEASVASLTRVIESSHTPEKAFGYILNQLSLAPNVAPRLAVGTHFPATDNTVHEAMLQIRSWYPRGDVAVASDLMVINVTKRAIRQRRALVSDYTWATLINPPAGTTYATPKYWTWGDAAKTTKVGDPYAQLDPTADTIDSDIYDPS